MQFRPEGSPAQQPTLPTVFSIAKRYSPAGSGDGSVTRFVALSCSLVNLLEASGASDTVFFTLPFHSYTERSASYTPLTLQVGIEKEKALIFPPTFSLTPSLPIFSATATADAAPVPELTLTSATAPVRTAVKTDTASRVSSRAAVSAAIFCFLFIYRHPPLPCRVRYAGRAVGVPRRRLRPSRRPGSSTL